MEQKLYTCDRCRATAKVDKSHWSQVQRHWSQVQYQYTGTPKDLCPACTKDFENFMKIRGPLEGKR